MKSSRVVIQGNRRRSEISALNLEEPLLVLRACARALATRFTGYIIVRGRVNNERSGRDR